MNKQQFYNNVCQSLRDNGNPYGGYYERGWGWVDSSAPGNRCAIARFVSGGTDFEVQKNLKKILVSWNEDIFKMNSLVHTVTSLFDNHPDKCNDKEQLEIQLQSVADLYNLTYTPVKALETA